MRSERIVIHGPGGTGSECPIDAGGKVDLSPQVQARFPAAAADRSAGQRQILCAEVNVRLFRRDMIYQLCIDIAAIDKLGESKFSRVRGAPDKFVIFVIAGDKPKGWADAGIKPETPAQININRRSEFEDVEGDVKFSGAGDGTGVVTDGKDRKNYW